MRRCIAMGISLLACLSHACSWNHAGPNPIEQALAFANCCIAVQVLTTGVAVLWALRHRRTLIALPLFIVFPALTKLAMGTAYSGDCGGFAGLVALVSAGMALSLFAAMLAMERRKGLRVRG